MGAESEAEDDLSTADHANIVLAVRTMDQERQRAK
jgi:hypothetical protein